MKIRFVQHYFLRNIIRLRSNPSISSTHASTSHIETWFEFETNYLTFYNNFFVSQVKNLLWNFLNYVSMTKEVDYICHFWFLLNVTINWLLVFKLLTSHLTLPFNIISKKVSLVQISTSHHVSNLRYTLHFLKSELD